MKFSGPKNNKSQNIKFYETLVFPIFTIFFHNYIKSSGLS